MTKPKPKKTKKGVVATITITADSGFAITGEMNVRAYKLRSVQPEDYALDENGFRSEDAPDWPDHAAPGEEIWMLVGTRP